jgi:lipid-A-disaccharide synthase-like uncharacterized protein
MDKLEIYIFLSAFAVSGLAGLAALLRSEKEFSRKNAFAYFLNSGILGLGISLLWYMQMQDNVFMLVGLCVLCGLGGMSSVDFFVDLAKKGASFFKKPENKQ